MEEKKKKSKDKSKKKNSTRKILKKLLINIKNAIVANIFLKKQRRGKKRDIKLPSYCVKRAIVSKIMSINEEQKS